MTPEQHQRWLELSVGLARHGFPNMTERRRAKLVAEVEDVILWLDDEAIICWDSSPVYVCDEVDRMLEPDHFHGENGSRENRFLRQVTACVRSGFDVAVAPSAGVLGYFTVDDLRRVYPHGLPDWVQAFFAQPISSDTPGDFGVWL